MIKQCLSQKFKTWRGLKPLQELSDLSQKRSVEIIFKAKSAIEIPTANFSYNAVLD